ncbi:hypothetical protein ACLKA7_004380 [Drosophila subpalustris]
MLSFNCWSSSLIIISCHCNVNLPLYNFGTKANPKMTCTYCILAQGIGNKCKTKKHREKRKHQQCGIGVTCPEPHLQSWTALWEEKARAVEGTEVRLSHRTFIMIRLKQIASDQIEERAKDEVRASLIIFTVLCATIRFAPILILETTNYEPLSALVPRSTTPGKEREGENRNGVEIGRKKEKEEDPRPRRLCVTQQTEQRAGNQARMQPAKGSTVPPKHMPSWGPSELIRAISQPVDGAAAQMRDRYEGHEYVDMDVTMNVNVTVTVTVDVVVMVEMHAHLQTPLIAPANGHRLIPKAAFGQLAASA